MFIVGGLDLETTGFSAPKGDRIVEFAIQLWDAKTRRLLKSITQRINPLRSIPESAFKVHGISLEDLKDAPTWDKFAPAAHKAISMCKVLVAHNMNFDGPFLGEELIRMDLPPPPHIQTYCTMENGRWACPDGKSPKLGELAWALGVDYDPSAAHAADYDVEVMMQCLWKGIDAGRFQLPT